MPNIILRVEKSTDKVLKNENICCYSLSAELPKSFFDEALATEKMVLAEGNNALAKCKEYNLVSTGGSDYHAYPGQIFAKANFIYLGVTLICQKVKS